MQHLLGFQCVGYVEIEEYCQRIIRQRQEDGFIDRAPIFTDIRSFVSDGYAASYTGMVDIITGGFPCQDISCAGKGKGITGERSGLWSVMAEAIRIIRPRFAFVENSPMLTVRGLGTVLGDLAEMWVDAEWCVRGAIDVGAPHKRKRIWILAHDPGQRRGTGRQRRSDPGDTGERESEQSVQALANLLHPERWPSEQAGGHREQGNQTGRPQGSSEPGECGEDVADTEGVIGSPGFCENGQERHGDQLADGGDAADPCRSGLSLTEQERQHAGSTAECDRRPTEPGLGGMADGLADRMDRPWPPEPAGVPRVATGIQNRVARLKAIGNGQVPQCAALAWKVLNE